MAPSFSAAFLSPKTVEFHLARVYRKLDLASRAELICRFAAGGRPRLAANMLIWTKGTLTLRLEGAASLKQALAIAETLE